MTQATLTGKELARAAYKLRKRGFEFREIEDTMGIGAGCGKCAWRLVRTHQARLEERRAKARAHRKKTKARR